jgi:hypothetical protein
MGNSHYAAYHTCVGSNAVIQLKVRVSVISQVSLYGIENPSLCLLVCMCYLIILIVSLLYRDYYFSTHSKYYSS